MGNFIATSLASGNYIMRNNFSILFGNMTHDATYYLRRMIETWNGSLLEQSCGVIISKMDALFPCRLT